MRAPQTKLGAATPVAADPGMSASARLATFAAQLQFDDLSTATAQRAKLCLLDAIGCATFATTLPWSRIVGEYVIAMGGRAEATIWGTSCRVPAPNAALVNGTLVHGFELDDLHKKSIVHPGCVAIPAAMGVLENTSSATGADFLTAVVAGFEVAIRAGMSVGTSHLVRGFHPTGTSGAVGAAAAAGRAMKLSPRAMEHAISIAATQAAGLMSAQYESMVKRMHAGRASQSGVYGAQLASRGFVGIDHVLETEYGGYCSTYSDAPDLAILTSGLGTHFETDVVGFKTYACCGSCHTSVEAVKRLRARKTIAPSDVKSVQVHTSRATHLHVGWRYEPRGITSAQMNLPYCLAVTLHDGDAFVEQFTEARIHDAKVLDLASRVQVTPDPEIDALGPSGRHRVTVTLQLRDGTELVETVDHAKGSDADPLTPEEVVRKFFRLVEPIAGRAWANDMHDEAMSIDRADSLSPLRDLLSRTHSN